MKVGTKSVLFGAHCFFLHPIFVAIAWIKLYGFPFDPRIWLAFIVHDLGYWGKPNMDGSEGENHPQFGADIMFWLCDMPRAFFTKKSDMDNNEIVLKWYLFTKYHSRYLAKIDGRQPSKLCMADKLSFVVTPRWLYLPMVNATGEINEYLEKAKNNEKNWKPVQGQKAWHTQLKKYMTAWVEEHKDGREDSWTPKSRNTVLSKAQ